MPEPLFTIFGIVGRRSFCVVDVMRRVSEVEVMKVGEVVMLLVVGKDACSVATLESGAADSPQVVSTFCGHGERRIADAGWWGRGARLDCKGISCMRHSLVARSARACFLHICAGGAWR